MHPRARAQKDEDDFDPAVLHDVWPTPSLPLVMRTVTLRAPSCANRIKTLAYSVGNNHSGLALDILIVGGMFGPLRRRENQLRYVSAHAPAA